MHTVIRAGGRGRTGTALACLAILDGIPSAEAVTFVREHYDPHAAEKPGQRRYVAGGSGSGRKGLSGGDLLAAAAGTAD